MSHLLSLSDDLLKLILQHVPSPERLSSCCLVSRRMHAAAVAATDDLSVGIWPGYIPRHRTELVLQLLSRCGQHLTRLNLCEFPPHDAPLQQLPCPNLLELFLTHGSVQLGASDGYPGVIQGCTKLTRLELWDNNIGIPEGAVLDLSGLAHLQHLVIRPSTKLHGLSDATLPHLQDLTHLHTHSSLSTRNLLQLGGLTKLKELLLTDYFDTTHPWIAPEPDTAVGPSSVPGLAFPASLATLSLSIPMEVGILSLVPVGLLDLRVGNFVDGPAEGPSSLLSCMARLQHLTALSLRPYSLPDWPPPGPAYLALTASSKLVKLEICHTSCPQGVWPFVFPTSCKLPYLTGLEFLAANDSGADMPSWSAADISSLVSCCPNLCAAETLSMQPGLHVSELHKLAALTRLRVYYHPDDPDNFEDSVRGLAVVSQLLDLNLKHDHSPHVKVASLLPLTSLTALIRLIVRADVNSDPTFGVHIALSSKAQAGCAPDVWLQLLERCAAEPGGQCTALATVAQQLAEQRAAIARQQQQIACLQQQVSDQQQQIAGMQEQLQDLLVPHQQ